MGQKWYQKATVQAAIVGSLGLTVAGLIPYALQVPSLEEKTANLEEDVRRRDAEILRLEALLAPFRTVALQRYVGSEGEALAKLAAQISSIESKYLALREYSTVATLDALGRRFKGDIEDRSPLAVMFDGMYENLPTNEFKVRKDAEAEARYREIISSNPNFPFAYYYLGLCLRGKGDPEWVGELQKAASILEQTTSIYGHNPDHDDVLNRIRLLLNQVPGE